MGAHKGSTMYCPSPGVISRVRNSFTYHPPLANSNQAERYELIRAEALRLAEYLLTVTPESAEQIIAIKNLEQVVFWANAAIARNEKEVE